MAIKSVMARRATTISVSPERAAQLRTLAKLKQQTLAELIGEYVRAEIRAGRLADEIPGYVVQASAKNVRFATESASVLLKPCHARELAEGLERVAAPGGFIADFQGGWITRRGKGLNIRMGRHKKSLSPDIARDLARMLRAAAKKAGR